MLPKIVVEAAESDPTPPSKPAIPTVSPETASFLLPYLPPSPAHNTAAAAHSPADVDAIGPVPTVQTRPFVTLTYATSLDSHLAIALGTQTALSGPLTKSLTHYLRSKHDGILIGAGTAIADDPGLNCRLEGVGGYTNDNGEEDNSAITLDTLLKMKMSDEADDEAGPDPLFGQPRPIILDPNRRWHFTRDSRIFQAVREWKGKAPIILTRAESRQGPGEAERWRILCEHGGMFMCLKEEGSSKDDGKGYGKSDSKGDTKSGSRSDGKKKKDTGRWSWKHILEFLYAEAGIKSLMIEGGGGVINDLLGKEENLVLIDSVVVTIAPVYLGKGGVNVSPESGTVGGTKVEAVRFKDVEWTVLGRDVVMAARPIIPSKLLSA